MVAVAPLAAPTTLRLVPSPAHRAEDYVGLVRKVAFAMARRLPAHVDVDDLVGAGTTGLLDAIAKYDPRRNDNFEAYAELRIRGAIGDELRRLDWVPRSVRIKNRTLSAATRTLESELGRPAEETEVAAALQLSMKALHQLRDAATARTMTSLEDLVGTAGDAALGSADDDVLGQLCHRATTAALAQAIDQLGERDRTVLSLYYFEDVSQKEIGAILGVTESRICQILKRAIKTLGESMQDAA